MNHDRLDLPVFTPDQDRSARTAKRCREKLSRRRQRAVIVERALVGGFSLAYLAALAFSSFGLI